MRIRAPGLCAGRLRRRTRRYGRRVARFLYEGKRISSPLSTLPVGTSQIVVALSMAATRPSSVGLRGVRAQSERLAPSDQCS
jgi:hypothetical protein